MPEKLAGASSHGRVVHAVAETAAGVDNTSCARDCRAVRAGPVEQQCIIFSPNLRVASYRLVVQADRRWLGREQRDRDLIGVHPIAVDASVARDSLPAVRARDVRNDAMPIRTLSSDRIRLVEPARLRDAN